MSNRTEPKQIFNLASDEGYNEAKILGGNPNGIVNFEKSNHGWAYKMWIKMQNRTWFPTQINISQDKLNYSKLTEPMLRAYDLVLAQLIANDSINGNQLTDRINQFITSPVVNACLTKQAYEEFVHSHSYSVIAEEICKDTNRIFNMHKEDAELAKKNLIVENMYKELHQGDNPTNEDMLIVFVANQILEELVFPGGFAIMLSLEQYMPGTAQMFKEIMKDETLSHVILFKMIYRTAVKETFNGVVPQSVKDKAMKMILDMEKAEVEWTKYVSKGLPGFSDEIIEGFMRTRVNNICGNLLLEKPYKDVKSNPLTTLLAKGLPVEDVEVKTNFLEQVNGGLDYQIGGLKMDF